MPKIEKNLASVDHNRSEFALTNFQKKLIVVTGGRIGQRVTKTALAYTLATNTYSELVPMNKAREDHSSTAIGNSVWVFGGVNGSGPLNSIERLKICRENLTTTARKWEMIQPHKEFAARANSAVCNISRHKMLILGGNVSKGYLSDIWVMDAKRKTMKKIANAPFAFHCQG